MDLGTHLKSKNKDPDSFAKEISVTPYTVKRYIAGSRIPTKDVMPRIIRATGGEVTANDFYERAAEYARQAKAGLSAIAS